VAVGQQDARVDEGGVGQAGDGVGQGFGAVAVQQLAEDGARRSRAGGGAGLGEAARGAEPALFDEGSDAAGHATVQPPESGRGDSAGDQQLGAAIREDFGECG